MMTAWPFVTEYRLHITGPAHPVETQVCCTNPIPVSGRRAQDHGRPALRTISVCISFPTDLRQEHEAVDRAVARLEAEYAENLPPFILSTQATDVLDLLRKGTDLLRKGTSNVKIAEQLSISKGVLQSHINAILNCPEVRDRARFGRRSDGSDGDESSKGQLNLGTIFSIKNTSHIEEYFVMDLDPVDCDIFFRIF